MNRARDVVLLHGWGMKARVWQEFAGLLAPLRVRAQELPGYGGSPACVPYMLETVAAALARAAPAHCDVVGWSLGGLVALAWAQAAPEQVERLVLVATTPCFAIRPHWSDAVADQALAGFEHDLQTDRDGTLLRFATLQAHGDRNARQVARRLRAAVVERADAPDMVLIGGLRILRATDLRASLASIRQRTLLLHGDRDGLVPPAGAKYLARALADARLCVMEGAGHAPFLSRPRETASLVREFLDG